MCVCMYEHVCICRYMYARIDVIRLSCTLFFLSCTLFSPNYPSTHLYHIWEHHPLCSSLLSAPLLSCALRLRPLRGKQKSRAEQRRERERAEEQSWTHMSH